MHAGLLAACQRIIVKEATLVAALILHADAAMAIDGLQAPARGTGQHYKCDQGLQMPCQLR